LTKTRGQPFPRSRSPTIPRIICRRRFADEPTKSTSVTTAPDWLREVKYDGYRLRVERIALKVRLMTRGGYGWTRRYPHPRMPGGSKTKVDKKGWRQ